MELEKAVALVNGALRHPTLRLNAEEWEAVKEGFNVVIQALNELLELRKQKAAAEEAAKAAATAEPAEAPSDV